MQLTKFKIKKFRAYEEEFVISFDNLTTFFGKNDVGKSSIMEALYLFFNYNPKKGLVKFEKDDLNIECQKRGDEETILSACFSDLPDQVTIDEAHSTSLSEEYLLNSSGQYNI